VFALSEPMQAFLKSEYFLPEVADKGAERGLADALYSKHALRRQHRTGDAAQDDGRRLRASEEPVRQRGAARTLQS
jgi:hypothetical protein